MDKSLTYSGAIQTLRFSFGSYTALILQDTAVAKRLKTGYLVIFGSNREDMQPDRHRRVSVV
ncbi:MAG TPA: hypothetical protein PKI59_00655 [Candidatus Cloacimonadota bacterium]|jgi:hypothetical protein|nr:hypothetical protein [Candidatus Cloacimonadota bacterium]